jgi:Protein of unknown function (DUF2911)
MKSLLLLAIASTTVLFACGQGGGDKSKRPSPPVVIKETIASGAEITIDYSQPAVKGRKIGTELEPKTGQVWRTGANEATVFEVSKDVKIEGQVLPAGKYAFFTIENGAEWTLIFNKTWKQWGAFAYKQADDALRVNVKAGKAASFSEKLVFATDKSGKVSFEWGDYKVGFKVE